MSKREMRRLLPDGSPRTLLVASGLGAASSSCSYASVALARSLFRKGADFTAAMTFEIASTNLVVELGIIMALLLGWEFVVAHGQGESHFLLHFRQRQGHSLARVLHLTLPLIGHVAGLAPAIALLGLIARGASRRGSFVSSASVPAVSKP